MGADIILPSYTLRASTARSWRSRRLPARRRATHDPVRRRWPELLFALFAFALIAWRPQKAMIVVALVALALYFAPSLWRRLRGAP